MKATAWARPAWASISTSPTPSTGWARRPSASATATCSTCTSASPTKIPYKVPMRIYPAIHYTMGGLWVDYELQSTIPGLFVLGEANFSDHGANRLGASALMQGLSDGYFVIPYTVGNYLATNKFPKVDESNAEVQEAGREVQAEDRQAALHQGQAHGRLVPSRAGQDRVGLLRHGAHRARA